jgi:hypothetical protein
MNRPTAYGPAATAKHGMLLLAALIAAMAMYFAAQPSPASAQNNFCEGAFLAPYGQGGDRCWGPVHHLFGVGVVTGERAGCVDIADGSNNLLRSWNCGPANSVPGEAANMFWGSNDGVNRKGVIRNNNTSYSGYFYGIESCYTGC